MKILDAFDPQVIEEINDAIDEGDEEDLVLWADSYSTDTHVQARNEPDYSPTNTSEQVRRNTAILAFMAGMAYQQSAEQNQRFPIMMNQETLGLFIDFLASQAAQA